MKKKIFLMITVILVLSFALAGCSLFTINEERDYKQSVASLVVDGVEVNITKGELNESFVQTYQQYSQYGISAEESLNLALVNLAKKQVMLVIAKKAFGDKAATAYDVLNANEQAWVMKTTNKMFKDSWDSSIKEKAKDKYGKEQDKIKEDKKEDILYDPRSEYAEPEKGTEYKKYETYTLQTDFFTEHNNATGIEKEALDELKENLEEQYKDFNYFKERNAESRLLSKYQELHNGGDIIVSDEDLTEKYQFTVSANKDKYLKGTAYATDIEKDAGDILYHKGQYFKVKSILLQFGEKQSALYKNWAAQYPSEDSKTELNNYRTALAIGDDSNSLITSMANSFNYKIDDVNRGILSNISNIKYKAGTYCTNDDCKCHNDKDYHKQLREDIENRVTVWGDKDNLDKPLCDCPQCEFNAYVAYNVPFDTILKTIADDIAAVAVAAEAEYNTKYSATGSNDSAVIAGRKMYIADKKLEAFDKWIYRVNDDSGMFGGKEYVVTPAGQSTTYVAEYTALARAIIADKDNVTRGTTATTRQEYTIGKDKVDILNATSSDGNSISYIVNDFGVHIIMISTLPVDYSLNKNQITAEADAEFDIAKYGTLDSAKATELNFANQMFTLSIDAFKSFDEETGKAITYKETIRKTYQDNAKGQAYSVFETKLLKPLGTVDDFFTKALKKGIELSVGDTKYLVTIAKDNSVYNQLLKEAKKIDASQAQRQA